MADFARRSLLAAALALTANAATGAAATAGEAGHDAPAGQYVDLAPVALPVVLDGKLINYVFVYVRINFTSSANSPRLREKEPYFRDALVRLGHRTPFTKADDYTAIDTVRLRAAMLTAAGAIAGPGSISSIVVVSQTPKVRTGLPKPPGR